MIKRAIIYLFLVFPLMLFGIFCDHSADPHINDDQYSFTTPVQTNDGWETASLTEAGMDPDSLESLMDLISQTENHMIHSVLIIKDSKLVFEEYFNGFDIPLSGVLSVAAKSFDREALHYQASVSKSVTSALVGIAVDRGLIASIEEPLFLLFPEYQSLLNSEDITLFHLLSMTSGLEWNEFVYDWGDPRDSHYQLFAASDPIEFLLGRPLVTEPGELFHYNSGDTNLLGEVVRTASNSDYLIDFAVTYLFEPLGIESFHWNRFPNDEHVTFASGGLFLRPRDMAKFGELYLNEGSWNGEQIISASWINSSSEMSIPLIGNYTTLYGYGYQWWLGRYRYKSTEIEYYRALGWGGQYIIVMPALDMVVVFTAGGYFESRPISFNRVVEEYILKAIVE